VWGLRCVGGDVTHDACWQVREQTAMRGEWARMSQLMDQLLQQQQQQQQQQFNSSAAQRISEPSSSNVDEAILHLRNEREQLQHAVEEQVLAADALCYFPRKSDAAALHLPAQCQ
jgi:hypothetical protein